MSIGHNSWLAQPARVIFRSGLSASFEGSREPSAAASRAWQPCCDDEL
jgi:hypothetical protein